MNAHLHALLATSRIANVPSVVSNVWLGAAIAFAWSGFALEDFWLRAALLSVAGVSLYVSGNFLNDWMDRDWDRVHRPERALPSGRFSPKLYLATAFAAAVTGCLLAALANPLSGIIAILLLICIFVYTWWHKRVSWAVIPMGLCRALLPLLGAFGVAGTLAAHSDFVGYISASSAALFCYIAGLSLSARYESLSAPPKSALFVARALLALSAVAMAWWSLVHRTQLAITGLFPFCTWLLLSLTRYRSPVSTHVSALLAGIPLLDAVALLPLALAVAPAGDPWRTPFTAICAMLPLAAFLLGRMLQRVAPAT